MTSRPIAVGAIERMLTSHEESFSRVVRVVCVSFLARATDLDAQAR